MNGREISHYAQCSNHSRSRSKIRVLHRLPPLFDGERHPQRPEERGYLADRRRVIASVPQDNSEAGSQAEAETEWLNYIRISYIISLLMEGKRGYGAG